MSQTTLKHNSARAKTPGETTVGTCPLTYVFTGGGTGGHVYPGLAIADEVRSRNPNARIIYIGARGRMEATLVPSRGYPIHLVFARGLPAIRRPLPLLLFAISTSFGIFQSAFHLLRYRPRMIVATGGYASSPVLLAHALLKLLFLSGARRCFVHEQNVIPGKVNQLAGHIADQIGVSFQASLRHFPPGKASFLGYPVRREIGAVARAKARASQNLPANAKVIFAFGASSGARSINRAIIDTLPQLLARPDIHVIHVIGQTQNTDYNAEIDSRIRLGKINLTNEQRLRYHQSSYSHEIEKLYAVSDLVISRSSAGVITEIGVCGIPSILVPLPYAPGDHQAMNARALESIGAASVVYESISYEEGETIGTINNKRLTSLIFALIDNPARHSTMAARAREAFDRGGLERIVDQLDHLLTDMPVNNVLPTENSGKSDGADHVAPLTPVLSPYSLSRRFAKGLDQAFIDSVGEEYLKYRIDGFLKDTRWQIRNEGVKLVGLLGYRDRLPFILSLLRDKTPAPKLQRIFGGDYRQVGFIRRNAVSTVSQLGVYNESVRATLLDLLVDPYYEVRSTAAKTFASLAPDTETTDKEVLNSLRSLLKGSSFEIKSAAILAIGKIGDGAVLNDLRSYYLDPSWKVRQAVIYALTELVNRNLITDLDSLQQELDGILVTCNHFDPDFPIKRDLNRLIEIIDNQQESL